MGLPSMQAFIVTYNMISSFFTVCLLTHGMFILCFIIMFMPNMTSTSQYKIESRL